MKPFLLVAVFLAVAIVRGEEKFPPQSVDPDVSALLGAAHFSFGPVGFAGITSSGEIAFNRIAKRKEAAWLFAAAFQRGETVPHARCYALVALRELDPDAFRSALAVAQKNPPEKISTMSGCILTTHAPEEIYAAIEKGTYASYVKLAGDKPGSRELPRLPEAAHGK